MPFVLQSTLAGFDFLDSEILSPESTLTGSIWYYDTNSALVICAN